MKVKTNGKKSKISFPENGKADSEGEDLSFECNPDIPPLVPPGEYEVGFLRAEKKWLWKREKLFLWFRIATFGEWHDTGLYMACNIAPNGKWTTGHKFYRAWVVAEKKRKPDRFDRMSTNVFKEKLFKARIRIVEKTSKGTKRIPELQYSVIDELVERLQ